MIVEVIIENEGKIYAPAIIDGINLEQYRKGSPSKLALSIIYDENINIAEGNALRLSIDNKPIFYGFIFSRSISSKDKNALDIVAYDQLRYLKNKDTYVYENKTLGELVSMIAKDYRLQVGNVSSSSYVIPSRTEDNATLFDIIGNAIDETMQATGKIYYLYDDVGKLTLKNIEDTKYNLLITWDTAGEYEYKSSIDDKTYNQVKIVFENDETKKREVFISKDSTNINKWGVLQYNDTVKTKGAGQTKAEALLKFYNKPTKTLSLSKVVGDTNLRAGMSIIVELEIDKEKIRQYMLCEYVKHEFKDNEHFMSLRLRGGLFVA